MTECVNCAKFKGCDLSSPNVNECADYKEILTNEEWFCQLTTEEKAKFLDRICYSAWGDRNSRFKDMADYTDWVEWLKEKHE